jgi:hypothetical protein
MSEYTEALQKVVNFLEANEDLFGSSMYDVTVHIDATDLNIFIPTWAKGSVKVDQKSILRQVVRAIPGKLEKDFSGTTMYLKQEGAFGFFDLTVFANREGVCERKLVGMKDVDVPAVKAVKAHVESTPIYEWECGSIFDDAPQREHTFEDTLAEVHQVSESNAERELVGA